MATNKYGQNYEGEDNFRGWLAALGNDTGAKHLLNMVGNDGRVGEGGAYTEMYNKFFGPGAGRGPTLTAQGLADKYYKQWQSGRQNNNIQQPVNPLGAYAAVQSAETARQQAEAARRQQEAERKQREAEEKAERERQRMVGYYNNIITRKNDAINDLSGSLQNSLDEINGNYNTYKNEQQSSYDKERSKYDTSSKHNTQSLVTNRNTITNNASQGLRGLFRVLGAMGAGGGSVARYNAPNAVKAQADQENANAGLTYAQNQANLDTDWGNYKNEFENDKKKLEDWRTGQIKSAKQNTEQRRIGLLEELADAYANRASYDADPGDNISQITARIKQANQSIKDLGKYTTPAYSGTTAVFDTPNLSDYDTAQTDLSTTVNESAPASSPTLLTVLRELNKRKQSSPYLYGNGE